MTTYEIKQETANPHFFNFQEVFLHILYGCTLHVEADNPLLNYTQSEAFNYKWFDIKISDKPPETSNVPFSIELNDFQEIVSIEPYPKGKKSYLANSELSTEELSTVIVELNTLFKFGTVFYSLYIDGTKVDTMLSIADPTKKDKVIEEIAKEHGIKISDIVVSTL